MSEAAEIEDGKSPYGSIYPWLVVGILLLTYTVSFIDRQLISLLVEPIRADLNISDTQISLLQGLAFALFYTFMGIPIAKAADRRSRRNIIVLGVTFWSLMTAFCGLAKNYWTLFIGRLGVGVGEAALSPASYSMIADYFSEKRLGTALAIYGAGPFIGSGLAFILGGAAIAYLERIGGLTLPVLGQIANWQAAFIVVGLPGVLVALLIRFVVREPDRKKGAPIGEEVQEAEQTSHFLSDVLPYLIKNLRFYLFHALGMGFISLVAYATFAWLPTFFLRVHGWEMGLIAQTIGGIVLVSGVIGVMLGGRFADYLLQKRGHKDASMRAVFYGALFIAPASAGATLTGSVPLTLICSAAVFFLVAFPYGAGVAALQLATPPHYRAQASAVYIFFNNMLGLAVGPTAVALLTDYALRDANAVGQSLAIVGICAGIIASTCCFISLKPLRELTQRRSPT